jgi:hypothetical protein
VALTDDPGLTTAVVAGIVTTALVGVAVTWMVRCGQQFHRLERTTGERLVERQATQEDRIGDALALILRTVLPQIIGTYLEKYSPPAPLSSAELKRAAKEMDEDDDLRDLRARRLVTQPVIDALLPGLDEALPAIAGSISRLPSVDEAILRLRCYAGAARGINRRATRLAWRFGGQAVALLTILIGALASALGYASRELVLVAGLLVVLHGLWSELQLRRLDRDLALLPSVLDQGAV